jgi:hypothetical protein
MELYSKQVISQNTKQVSENKKKNAITPCILSDNNRIKTNPTANETVENIQTRGDLTKYC